MEEKRAHPRIQLQEIVKYANGIKAAARDVSLSGIRFIGGELLPEGTPLNLYFPIGKKNTLVKTTGRIIWSRGREAKRFESGFHFVSIDKTGRLRLSEHINSYLQCRVQQRLLIEVLVNYCIHAKAKTFNITPDGMFLYTATPLAEKKILLLSIPLPAGDQISMHGKSIWNRQLQQNLFENRIEFWHIDHLEKEKLITLMQAV